MFFKLFTECFLTKASLHFWNQQKLPSLYTQDDLFEEKNIHLSEWLFFMFSIQNIFLLKRPKIISENILRDLFLNQNARHVIFLINVPTTQVEHFLKPWPNLEWPNLERPNLERLNVERPNLERPNIEKDRTSKDQTLKGTKHQKTERRMGPNVERLNFKRPNFE